MDFNIGYKVVSEVDGEFYSYSVCLIKENYLIEGTAFKKLPKTRYRMLRIVKPHIPYSPIFAFDSFENAKVFLLGHLEYSRNLRMLKGLVPKENPYYLSRIKEKGIFSTLCYDGDWNLMNDLWGDINLHSLVRTSSANITNHVPKGTILVDYFFPIKEMSPNLLEEAL